MFDQRLERVAEKTSSCRMANDDYDIALKLKATKFYKLYLDSDESKV
jgi:hypothetical protein